jgi:hypothetical protein
MRLCVTARKMTMSVKATALTFAALSLLLALAALPAVIWAPGATTSYWGDKPSLNRYHNERLKQDRLSAGGTPHQAHG